MRFRILVTLTFRTLKRKYQPSKISSQIQIYRVLEVKIKVDTVPLQTSRNWHIIKRTQTSLIPKLSITLYREESQSKKRKRLQRVVSMSDDKLEKTSPQTMMMRTLKSLKELFLSSCKTFQALHFHQLIHWVTE